MSDVKRIVLATDAWHPQTSGVVTALTRMKEMLEDRGREVLVIHPGLFPAVPCPTYPEIKLSIAPGRKLGRMLREFRPHAVHVPAEGPIGLAARNFCVRRRMPFTTSYMTRFPEYIEIRAWIPAAATYRVLRWFHSRAKRTSVSTQSLWGDLTDRGFDNLTWWERGVKTDLFKPRDKSAIDAPRPISMYMGRVAPEKNIQAFLDLDLPGTRVVIGNGPSLERLDKEYPEVRFLGRKTGLDLAVHLEAADVFVFPSLTDTFGIVLIEAMACGVPVAAYPVMGPRDVVVHGQTGWLDDDLGTAVRKALEMSPAACREHAAKYTWDRSCDQFEAMLAPIPDSAWR